MKPQLDEAVGAFGRDGRREATIWSRRSRDRYPLRTRQAHACKEARQSRTPDQTCQRVRSALTQWVRGIEGGEANFHKDFQDETSGQLRNLGSSIAPFPDDAGNLGDMAHASHNGRQMRPMGNLNGEMEQREQAFWISIHRDMLDI